MKLWRIKVFKTLATTIEHLYDIKSILIGQEHINLSQTVQKGKLSVQNLKLAVQHGEIEND